MNAIEINNLSVSYGDVAVIKDLSISIPKGKISVIIGSNGSGKSTLLKTIGRIIKPKNGTIYINGKDVHKQHPKQLAKEVAVLPQGPRTPDGLLVRELVAFGRFPHGNTYGGLTLHDKEIVSWAIQETGLAEFAERTVDSLSGGQRQRAWIALALAQETDLMLLDEPTTYLDLAFQLEILLLLQQLNKEQNRTIVMVLHELNNACRFADNIIGMRKGEVVIHGKPNQVITEDSLYQIYGIRAQLSLGNDTNRQYPICYDYNF